MTTSRVHTSDSVRLFTDDSFVKRISGALFVEFQKNGARQVFRAGWITDVKSVKGIVNITFNPAICIKGGQSVEAELGLICIGLNEELSLFNLHKEYHFASGESNHFSIYPAGGLVAPHLVGTLKGLNHYYSLLKRGHLITQEQKTQPVRDDLQAFAGRGVGLI